MKERAMVHSKESAIAKLFAGEMAVWVTDHAVQILSGYACAKDFSVERYLQNAKSPQIDEGTQEMQRTMIVRALMGTV
jgi:butyryl-CoA dehydrogenase